MTEFKENKKKWNFKSVAIILVFLGFVLFLLFGKSINVYFDKKTLKGKVALELKDPESADFRGIRKVNFGYCGEVNAKNSMGGYTGFKPFHGYKSLSRNEWDVTFFENIIEIHCK